MSAVTRAYLRRVAKTFGRLRSNPVFDASEAWVPADRLRIFWFIQTYRDLSRLCSTLDRLRRLYPESSVLVVSDGDPDPGIERACDEHSVGFVAGSRLFGVEQGGEPVQRMLEAFLATDTDILIKIDPDTDLRRRFARLPARHACSVYGSVQSAGPEANSLSSIQGGCIIIPREAALRVASSALLRSERLKPPALEWAVGEMSIARAASGLTSYDWTLGWACRELGILSKDHPEVFSRYLPSLVDTITARRISVSHPRFEIRQILNPVFYFSGVRAAVREIMRPSDVSRTGQLTPPRSKTV